MSAGRIRKTPTAGLCGSATHSGLMFLKSQIGRLPFFQPYQDLQQALGQVVGGSVHPLLPWALSFVNGSVLLGFLFVSPTAGCRVKAEPSRDGPWRVRLDGDGAGVLSAAGRGPFATGAGLGFRPAVFSLLMVLSYSMIMGAIFSVPKAGGVAAQDAR